MTTSTLIRNAVLRGREIIRKQSAPTPAPITKEAARVNLERFAGLLERLHASREEMDRNHRLASGVKGQDLSDLLLAGDELPDLDALEGNAGCSTLRAAVTLQALNRLLPSAVASVGILQRWKRSTVERLEAKAKEELAPDRPSWMNGDDFDRAMLKAPTIIHIHNLTFISSPSIPSIQGDDGKLSLPEYRTAPRTDWQKLTGDNGDRFNPSALASSLRRWLEHLAAVEGMAG